MNREFSQFGVAFGVYLEPALCGVLLHEDEERLASSLGAVSADRFRFGRRAVRVLARSAGISLDGPVGRGASREPLFPEGIVGSISHDRGVYGAALAHAKSIRGLGIDIQWFDERLGAILPRTARTEEREWILSDVDDAMTIRRAALHFSMKESIYKAMFRIVGPLGFQDATVLPRGAIHGAGEVDVTILSPRCVPIREGHAIRGIFEFGDTFVVTSVVVSRDL